MARNQECGEAEIGVVGAARPRQRDQMARAVGVADPDFSPPSAAIRPPTSSARVFTAAASLPRLRLRQRQRDQGAALEQVGQDSGVRCACDP